MPTAEPTKKLWFFFAKSVFKKWSGTFVRSTLRAVPAKVPDPFLNTLSGSKHLSSTHRRGRGQPELGQDRRRHVHQARSLGPDRAVAEQDAGHFQSVDAMVGAPSQIVVEENLLGEIAQDSGPGGAIPATVADDQVGCQGGGGARVNPIGAVDGADDPLAVDVGDRFQPAREFAQQGFLLFSRLDDAVALAALEV